MSSKVYSQALCLFNKADWSLKKAFLKEKSCPNFRVSEAIHRLTLLKSLYPIDFPQLASLKWLPWQKFSVKVFFTEILPNLKHLLQKSISIQKVSSSKKVKSSCGIQLLTQSDSSRIDSLFFTLPQVTTGCSGEQISGVRWNSQRAGGPVERRFVRGNWIEAELKSAKTEIEMNRGGRRC